MPWRCVAFINAEMADNYLERRMEDYRAGKNSRPLTPSRRKMATVQFPAMRVAMIGVEDQVGVAAVSALVQAGCRVAFTTAIFSDGQRIAQSTGGRFYPCEPRQMLEMLAAEGDAAAVVVYAPGSPEIPIGGAPRIFSINHPKPGAVTLSGGNASAVARMLVCLVAAPPMPEQIILC